MLSCQLFIFICFTFKTVSAATRVEINYSTGIESIKKLPRFWTNTGFAPPEPVETAGDFFESDDVNLNLEIIGSLPNEGLRNVRIHWLLNLLSISNYTTGRTQPLPVIDFGRLDKFLWKLIINYRLLPTIEFMTTLKFKKINGVVWEDLAYQLVSRNIGRYSVKNVKKWKFETWNEPDLKGYNRLNFTLREYSDYVAGISEGIKAAERQFSMKKTLKLRGPAGLFKSEKNHQFCWSVLKACNEKPEKCPIDIISFHRKGNGNDAAEILDGSLELLKDFNTKFPNLKNFKYSNSEADPIKKWSEPRDFQADSRYAAVVVETVFEHWQAMFDGQINLDSISHDNSFLNFYPNFFTQRTLLARFQMNNTVPKHIQFVQKPVFAALGLLSSLSSFAGKVNLLKDQNLSYIITTNNDSQKFFACILISSQVNLQNFVSETINVEISVNHLRPNNSTEELFYFAEGIDNERTNPSAVFQRNKSPPFPDYKVFSEMRKRHNPIILQQPSKVFNGTIIFNTRLTTPFVIAIRVCSKNILQPRKITNLRIRKVISEEIILFWTEPHRSRCTKTYEIFFKYSLDKSYQKVNTKHIPFMYHQLKHTIPGCFKVRSKDVFNRVSKLSSEICFDN